MQAQQEMEGWLQAKLALLRSQEIPHTNKASCTMADHVQAHALGRTAE